jgi:hypothetical protein
MQAVFFLTAVKEKSPGRMQAVFMKTCKIIS